MCEEGHAESYGCVVYPIAAEGVCGMLRDRNAAANCSLRRSFRSFCVFYFMCGIFLFCNVCICGGQKTTNHLRHTKILVYMYIYTLVFHIIAYGNATKKLSSTDSWSVQASSNPLPRSGPSAYGPS
jgi:hypothetical protein